MELYNIRNIAGQGIERGDPSEKKRATNGKILKTAIPIRTRYI